MIRASAVAGFAILALFVPDRLLAFNVMDAPVSGAGSTSIRTFRERSSNSKSSRLQMVTVSEPATTCSWLSHDLYDANPWLQLKLFLSLKNPTVRARS